MQDNNFNEQQDTDKHSGTAGLKSNTPTVVQHPGGTTSRAASSRDRYAGVGFLLSLVVFSVPFPAEGDDL